MKKHYVTHVEDTDKLISVAGPILEYKSWYEQYRKLMEEQAQRKYGLYTPTSEGDEDDFPSIPGMIARYSALGLTNEQMATNPVWVDKTGNGHDLQMKNFAWGGTSGVGGYVDNWNSSADWAINSYWVNSHTDHKLQFITASSVVQARSNNIYNAENVYKNILNVNGLTDEQLPLYPGALVFDGVDDYGVCDNFPILTKEKGYTVVALRQWITRGKGAFGLVSNVKSWSTDGTFVLEFFNAGIPYAISFGAVRAQKNLPHILTYQTSKSYNGVLIAAGNFEGTDVLHVGKLATAGLEGDYANAAIWELVFLDHDATEEELTKIKDYFVKTYPWLFPNQAWTVVGKTNEDEDRATIANITGNGNDLVLSNFAFSGNSGYGLYNIQKFTNWSHVANRGDIVKNGYSVTITNSKITGSSTNYNTDILYSYNSSSTTIIFKVTGLVDGQKIFLGRKSVTDAYVIDKDGIYRSDYNIPQKDGKVIVGIGTVGFIGECNITIEQIPEYEGYLVTDGVDDKVESSPFTLNKDWTIVGNWTMLSNIPSNCGIIKVSSMFLYNSLDGVTIYFAGGPIKIQSKSINAFCSDGRIYLNDWTEILKPDAQIASGGSKSSLNIASYSANFTKMAFKNLAIYDGKNLSKDDCIKAYNYLQTLKAK